MRSRKGLVQVQVHHVDAEVARTGLAHQSIHVRAVHVEQRALGVQDVGDLVNLVFEHADGRRIGQHQRRRVFVDHPLQLGDIDHALRIRLEVHHLVAAACRRRGIGAVGRVGDHDLLARIALATRGTRGPAGCR